MSKNIPNQTRARNAMATRGRWVQHRRCEHARRTWSPRKGRSPGAHATPSKTRQTRRRMCLPFPVRW
eukprot:11194584-Lingulodinium_polyedra.AAC.1